MKILLPILTLLTLMSSGNSISMELPSAAVYSDSDFYSELHAIADTYLPGTPTKSPRKPLAEANTNILHLLKHPLFCGDEIHAPKPFEEDFFSMSAEQASSDSEQEVVLTGVAPEPLHTALLQQRKSLKKQPIKITNKRTREEDLLIPGNFSKEVLCPKCPKALANAKDYIDHMNASHGTGGPIMMNQSKTEARQFFDCAICGKKLTNATDLVDHAIKDHF